MKKIRVVLIIVLISVFCFSGYKVASYYVNSTKEQAIFDDLLEKVENAESDETFSEDLNSMLAQYESLYNENSDFFGWLKIDDTVINYPVMHTPQDEEFYLHRSFDKSFSESGTLFLAADCYNGCGNYIVYGHNMKSGNMFGMLPRYSKKSYWNEHKTIHFDTLYAKGEYEVLAAFYSRVGDSFEYYRYTDLTDEENFYEFIMQIEKNKLYDTGVTAEYGDSLLTLSTCSYHTEDGRFVLVAKKCK